MLRIGKSSTRKGRRQRFVKALSIALAATALAPVTGVAAAAGPAEVGSWQPSAIAWKPCQEDSAGPTVQCGILRLPIDWARPDGEKFEMWVARRKSDQARRIGVLVANPGGPDDSGVDNVLRADTFFSQDVLARFDIIGFDRRGVKRSKPVVCSKELLRRQSSVNPRNQAEFDKRTADNRELSEDCRRHSGPIFDHADTLAVVQDMDALRRSLGEEKINYFGHSYGTLIGQQYAARYGDRIRAMAITAQLDHSLGTRQFMESSAATAEESFNGFVQWCARTPSCALHGRDVVEVWDNVLAKADRGEIPDQKDPDRALTSNQIIRSAVDLFKGPQWSTAAATLSKYDSQKPAAAHTFVADPELMPYPYLAVFCQDWQFRVKDYPQLAHLTKAELRAAPHMRGSPGHAFALGCVGWPDKVNNPQHRLRITDSPAILLLNARHDPVSSHAWAVNVHRQTRRSTVLVTYDGWGHSVYHRSTCTRGAVDDYLTDLTVPRDGTHCPPVEPT